MNEWEYKFVREKTERDLFAGVPISGGPPVSGTEGTDARPAGTATGKGGTQRRPSRAAAAVSRTPQ